MTLALLALTLCGCANLTAARLAPAPRSVDLAALETCERVLARLTLPAVTPGKTDARIAFEHDELALFIAADQIDAGRSCIGDVRERYAKGGG